MEKFIVGVLCVLARSVLLFNGATRAVQCYLLCQKKREEVRGRGALCMAEPAETARANRKLVVNC